MVSSYERESNENISGNEVYYTNALMFLVKNILCKNVHCQKGFNLIPFSYKPARSELDFKLESDPRPSIDTQPSTLNTQHSKLNTQNSKLNGKEWRINTQNSKLNGKEWRINSKSAHPPILSLNLSRTPSPITHRPHPSSNLLNTHHRSREKRECLKYSRTFT
jgi:hypothetical protein